MIAEITIRTLAVATLFTFISELQLLAQGSLTPPGAPAPTMKTLEQIEPRIALPPGSPTISAPGSYYLTANVQSIRIDVENVTLDLNGFSVIQTSDADGITINRGTNFSNVKIRNGSVVGPGKRASSGGDPWAATFAGSSRNGIVTLGRTAGTDTARNIQLEDITVRGFNIGINLSGFTEFDGRRALIENCTIFDCVTGIRAYSANITDVSVQTCTGNGIESDLSNLSNIVIERCQNLGLTGNINTIRNATVRFCGGTGINSFGSIYKEVNVTGAQIGIRADNSNFTDVNCANNRSHGIQGNANTIVNAICHDNGGNGIAGDSLTVNGAVVHSNAGTGILAPGSAIRGVRASNNSGAGVWCDDSTINECMIYNNAADGIRGVASTINACRSFNNDTNKGDGYTASDIFWNNGRQQANVAGSYFPAAPAP